MRDRDRPGAVARAVLAVAALTMLALASPARAQEPTDQGSAPTPAAPSTTTPGAAGIDLVSQTPFVAPTDTFRVGLDVSGAPEGAELAFSMHLPINASRGAADTRTPQARYDDFVAGKPDTTDDRWASTLTFPVANLPTNGSGTVEAAFEIVPDGEPPLVGFRFSEAGVYPLTIELREPEGGALLDSLTTYLVRLPAQTETAPPLVVAPLAELRAPVALRPDGARSIDPSALDQIHDLIEVLADQPATSLTLDATPETLEALAATTTVPATSSAPATTGADLVADLRRALAGRSVLGSTYVDLDVSAWTASGMRDALAYQRSHGANVAGAVLGGAEAIDEVTWRAAPGLSADGLAELNELGVDQVVLDGSVVGPVDAGAFPDAARSQVAETQPFDVEDARGGRVRAVATDASFGERLGTTDDPQLNAQILVADLAVTYFGASNPRVLDLPDAARGVTFQVPAGERSSQSLAPFLAALATTPPPAGGGAAIFAPGTVESLLALEPATIEGGDVAVRSVTPDTAPGAPADMGDYPTQLDAAEFAVSAYESMVVDTDPDQVRPLRQLLDVSGAAELDPNQRVQYLDAATGTVDAALAGVRVPEQDSITLTASAYEIPIVIENDLPYPVAVRVELASSKLTFPDGPDLVAQLQPGSNRVPVRVETVSAGTFPLDIEVRTPDRRVALGDETIEIRSTAVSGLGLALTIGAGFFLLVWWARNWRKTRRTAADGPAPAGDEPATAATDSTTTTAEPARFTVGPLADLADLAATDDETTTGTTSGDAPSTVPAGPGGVPPEPHQ